MSLGRSDEHDIVTDKKRLSFKCRDGAGVAMVLGGLAAMQQAVEDLEKHRGS